MPRQRRKRRFGLVIGCLGLLGVFGWVALAQSSMDGERDVVAERKELMKNTGANFKDMRLKAKEGRYDRMAVNAHTIAINARHIPMLFPEGSLGTPEQKSRAKPEIWQNWDTFTAAAKKTQDAALAIMKLARDAEKMGVSADEVDKALKALGGACKSCHKDFRKPKKKKK